MYGDFYDLEGVSREEADKIVEEEMKEVGLPCITMPTKMNVRCDAHKVGIVGAYIFVREDTYYWVYVGFNKETAEDLESLVADTAYDNNIRPNGFDRYVKDVVNDDGIVETYIVSSSDALEYFVNYLRKIHGY